jgi:hypothetical protein
MLKRYVALFSFVCSLSAQTTNVPKVIETYCSGCHTGSTKGPAGNQLDRFDASQIASHPEIWARAYRQLQAGTMPPVGAPRPNRATYAATLTAIETALGTNAKTAASNSQEIATRLASLLWNAAPDAALLDDAKRDKLNDSATLERHIRRMLADPRAESFVSRFFYKWLQLDRLEKAEPNKQHFPDYDPSLRDSLIKETQLFLLSQLRDDRDPIELWSANYTFVNEQLAKHYGITKVAGSEFRRVTSSPERAGLLGQGSVLMTTSRHSSGTDVAFTSPANRSVWVRRHFLGVNPPNAFPGAQPVNPDLAITPQTRTLPQDPCVTCHRNFFPLAYALENFDPLGRWRTHDQTGPVDASGSYVDGSSFNGPVQLRNVLLEHPDSFRTTITEHLLNFSATGSTKVMSGTPQTLIRARQILHGLDKPRWSAIIAGIVRTEPAK